MKGALTICHVCRNHVKANKARFIPYEPWPSLHGHWVCKEPCEAIYRKENKSDQ